MEARSTTPGDMPHDPDTERDLDEAQWRPGFDGWDTSSDPAASEPGLAAAVDRTQNEVDTDDPDTGDAVEPESDAPPISTIEWSREVAEAERAPWVPVRPERVRPPMPEPAARPAAEVEGLPPSAVTGQVVLAGIAVACVIAVAALTIAAILPTSEAEPAVRTAPLVPEQVDLSWTTDLDTAVGQVVTSADVVVVSTSPDAELVAFDMASGAERWRLTPAAPDRAPDRPTATVRDVAVIGDAVLVQQRGPNGAPMVTAFNAATGDLLWSSEDDGNYTITGVHDGHAVLRRFRRGDGTWAVMIDPATGVEVGDATAVTGVSTPGPFLAAEPADGKATIWSVTDGPLEGPVVDSFNLRTMAALGKGVVGLDLDARIVSFDRDGLRVDERPFDSDAFGDFTSRAELVGVVEHADVAVVGSGSSIGFTVDDGAIELVWQRPGRASEPIDTASGTFGVIVGPDAIGKINATIIDPATGETVAETDIGQTREVGPMLGHNAYVLSPVIGAADRVVSAVDYGGAEAWTLTIPAAADYHVADGVVVVVERTSTGSTLRLHR